MIRKIESFAFALAKEPPFRLLARQFVKRLPFNVRTKALWDVVERPQYLVGLLRGAMEARGEGVSEILAIEFGVAAGGGLLEMQKHAAAVEHETGVSIKVVGFDHGSGLPETCGDFRDHPDLWQPGDYPMNEDWLRNQLTDRTRLLIGNISETLDDFMVYEQESPVGFIAFDLDLYSSTQNAIKILQLPNRNILKRLPLYFDDTHGLIYHKYAGEYLAIRELNDQSSAVVIDKWHNIKIGRPFPENIWTEKMYMAHDLDQINKTKIRARPPLQLLDAYRVSV